MTRILVTVGTGRFEQLIEAVDQLFSPQLIAQHDFEFCCQIGQGQYIPSFPHFRFKADYLTDVKQADIIITHAGSGTVFELLELGKKLVVVPNTFRLDLHQQDLAQYVERHGFATVCWSLDALLGCVLQCQQAEFAQYQKEPFFMAEQLLEYLLDE